MENDFYQYQTGLMDKVTWEFKKQAIGFIYNRCNARVIYESRKRALSPEFLQIVESFPDECEE